MSAFSGPVHQRMYGKIRFQKVFTDRILSLSADKLLSERLAKKSGVNNAGEREAQLSVLAALELKYGR